MVYRGKVMNDVELLNQVGLGKIKMAKEDPFRFFVRSLMAGFYLGGAMILSYACGAILSKNYPEFGKIALAGTFGIGLVAIVFLGADLFTGNCLTTMIPVYDKKAKLKDLLPAWVICYIGNMVGMSIVGFLFIKSGSLNTLFPTYLKPLMETKLTFSVVPLFIKGILCNFLVCFAGYAGVKVKDGMVKFMIIMGFVMAFVLPGFEHCIANSGFFAMCITQYGTTLSQMGTICYHMLIASIGNILGGAVMAGLPVYLIFKESK